MYRIEPKEKLEEIKLTPANPVFDKQIGPVTAARDKVDLFVKLADQYIPSLNQIQTKASKSLEWRREWSFTFMFITFNVRWNVELEAGWTVQNEEAGVNFYKLNYTPYLLGHTYLWTGFNVPSARILVDPQLQYLFTYLTIDVTLHTDGEVCFNTAYHLAPSFYYLRFEGELEECKAEILDEVINQTPFSLACNRVGDVSVVLDQVELHDQFTYPLVNFCFEF